MHDPDAVRARILVVDDEQGPRESLRMILAPSHDVICARDGSEALDVLQTTPVDMVTLDLNMPGVKGDQLMHTLRAEFPQVEIIVITGYGTVESAAEGVRIGVCDYLKKPFDVVQVTGAVKRGLARRFAKRRLVNFLESLGDVVGRGREAHAVLREVRRSPALQEQVGELFETAALGSREEPGAPRTFEFLELLAATIESQDATMRGHARRVAYLAGLLSDRLNLWREAQEHVRIASFLHDLGKIGVPTDLLVRPASLGPEEQEVMRRHPVIGSSLVRRIGVTPSVVAAIRHHHERWDGGGYPDGLEGERIPLAARIVALADAYDAMTHDRPYRPALEPDAVLRELVTCAGSQFDPDLVKEFLVLVEAGVCDDEIDVVAESLTVAADLPRSGGAGRSVDTSGGATG